MSPGRTESPVMMEALMDLARGLVGVAVVFAVVVGSYRMTEEKPA